jgi:hypothetical protein
VTGSVDAVEKGLAQRRASCALENNCLTNVGGFVASLALGNVWDTRLTDPLQCGIMQTRPCQQGP